MKLLFVFRNRQSVEPFRGVVRGCLDRGHAVHVVVPTGDAKVPALFDPHPRLSFASFGLQRADEWSTAAPLLRSARDYLQYLRPVYRDARKLRKRVFRYLLEQVGVDPDSPHPDASETALALSEEWVSRLDHLAALCEDAMPSDSVHERAIAQFNPDAVLISPLLHFGSAQAEFVKAARSLGVPVGMMLFSWDNLSTKGALHVRPDRLFVWNERQRREAIELHGMPGEAICITGAPRFDAFFALQPLVDRETFCTSVGLDPGHPILLYLCSSKLVSEREATFIRRWHTVIRNSSDERLRTASILVRPHPDLPVADKKWLGPEETVRWRDDAGPMLFKRQMFGHRSTVMLYPRTGRASSLCESIRHSHLVVGLNTSAEIEAAIVGRPVFTILVDEESADGQQSTLHFKYLLKENGGFVSVSSSLSDHEQELREALAHPPAVEDIQHRVGTFVRPAGWQTPAANVLIEAIEREFGNWKASKADRGARIRATSSASLLSPTLDRRLPRGDQVQLTRVAYAPVELYIATSSPEEAAKGDLERHSPWVVKWLEGQSRPGQVFFVAPGDVGTLPLVAARGLGLTVFAFEGNIPRLARLWENIVLNACEGNVVPLPVALSDDRGLQKERSDSASPAARREIPKRRQWHQHRETRSVVVQACLALTLDGAVKTWSLPAPDILYLGPTTKVDEIIAGGVRTLTSSVHAVFVECERVEAAVAERALRAADFALAEQEEQVAGVALRFERKSP